LHPGENNRNKPEMVQAVKEGARQIKVATEDLANQEVPEMGTYVLRNSLREIVEFVARKATKPQIVGNLTRIKVEEEIIEAQWFQ
jgi:hypothetical protein